MKAFSQASMKKILRSRLILGQGSEGRIQVGLRQSRLVPVVESGETLLNPVFL
jgi:hypothetical protein